MGGDCCAMARVGVIRGLAEISGPRAVTEAAVRLRLLLAKIVTSQVALRAVGGDALRCERTKRENYDDGCDCERSRFEIGKFSPFEPSENGYRGQNIVMWRCYSGRLTWNDHEKPVGHNENLHGVDESRGRENTSVGHQMGDQLDVEDGAEPKDGGGRHDNHPVNAPKEELWRNGSHDGMVLHNGKGQARTNGQEHDNAGQYAGHILPEARPKGHHGPGLVHKRGLDDDDERQRECVGGEANVKVLVRDLREVAAPDLVEVAKGRDVVVEEQAGADDGDEQARAVQAGRDAAKLGRGREDEDDEQHEEAGAELGAVVDGGAEGLVPEGVEHGDGHRDGGVVVREEEGGVLGVRVKGWVGGWGAAVHDGRRGDVISSEIIERQIFKGSMAAEMADEKAVE